MSATTARPRARTTVPAPQPASKAAPGTAAPPQRKTSDLRRRMHQDLQLAGLSERTQEAYLRAVRQLAAHFKTPPDQLTEAQLREYLLFLKNDKQFAAASLKIAFCGTHGAAGLEDARENPRPSTQDAARCAHHRRSAALD